MITSKVISSEVTQIEIKDEATSVAQAFSDTAESIYSLSEDFDKISFLMRMNEEHELLASFASNMFLLMRSVEYIATVGNELNH